MTVHWGGEVSIDKRRNLTNRSFLNRLSPDYPVVGREYAPGSQQNTKIRAHIQPHTTRSTRLRKVTKGYTWLSKNTNIETHKDVEVRAPGFSPTPMSNLLRLHGHQCSVVAVHGPRARAHGPGWAGFFLQAHAVGPMGPRYKRMWLASRPNIV